MTGKSSNSIPRDRIGMDLLQCVTNSRGRNEGRAKTSQMEEEKKTISQKQAAVNMPFR